jgi:hypothetical protein
MLPHHVTEAELALLLRKSRGEVVGLVLYARELRELLVALRSHVSDPEPPLKDVFAGEVAGIRMEQHLARRH